MKKDIMLDYNTLKDINPNNYISNYLNKLLSNSKHITDIHNKLRCDYNMDMYQPSFTIQVHLSPNLYDKNIIDALYNTDTYINILNDYYDNYFNILKNELIKLSNDGNISIVCSDTSIMRNEGDFIFYKFYRENVSNMKDIVSHPYTKYYIQQFLSSILYRNSLIYSMRNNKNNISKKYNVYYNYLCNWIDINLFKDNEEVNDIYFRLPSYNVQNPLYKGIDDLSPFICRESKYQTIKEFISRYCKEYNLKHDYLRVKNVYFRYIGEILKVTYVILNGFVYKLFYDLKKNDISLVKINNVKSFIYLNRSFGGYRDKKFYETFDFYNDDFDVNLDGISDYKDLINRVKLLNTNDDEVTLYNKIIYK